MPYKDHEVLEPPSDRDSWIWRYISFEKLVAMLKQKYSIYEQFSLRKLDTDEKTGEGYEFKLNSDCDEFSRIEISYGYNMEFKFNSQDTHIYETGKIENYELKISYLDLASVEYNCKGWSSH